MTNLITAKQEKNQETKTGKTYVRLSFKKNRVSFSNYDESVFLMTPESCELVDKFTDILGGRDQSGNIKIKEISQEQVSSMIALANEFVEAVTQTFLSELRENPEAHLNREQSLRDLIKVRNLILIYLPLNRRSPIYNYMNIITPTPIDQEIALRYNLAGRTNKQDL